MKIKITMLIPEEAIMDRVGKDSTLKKRLELLEEKISSKYIELSFVPIDGMALILDDWKEELCFNDDDLDLLYELEFGDWAYVYFPRIRKDYIEIWIDNS